MLQITNSCARTLWWRTASSKLMLHLSVNGTSNTTVSLLARRRRLLLRRFESIGFLLTTWSRRECFHRGYQVIWTNTNATLFFFFFCLTLGWQGSREVHKEELQFVGQVEEETKDPHPWESPWRSVLHWKTLRLHLLKTWPIWTCWWLHSGGKRVRFLPQKAPKEEGRKGISKFS